MSSRRLNLIVANHKDLRVIEDWAVTIIATFQAAGHEVTLGSRFVHDRINVIMECFDEKSLGEIRAAAKQGCKIIIIATEYITGQTFNEFTSPSVFSRFQTQALLGITKIKFTRSFFKRMVPRQLTRAFYTQYLANRFRLFVEAAQLAHGVWVAEDRQLPDYLQLLGTGQNVAAFPYCQFDLPVRSSHKPNGSGMRSCDLFFSGSLTDYRMRIIQGLEARGFSVVKLPATTPLFLRNYFADSAQIVMDVKREQDWDYISNLRLHYHVQRGDFVVCEARKHKSCLQSYVHVVQADLSEEVERLLSMRDETIRLGRENLERFRVERPANRMVPELLERSGL